MLVWWKYRCDEDHAWQFLREADFDEREADALCEHGHEAATLQKLRPAGFARVGIAPAAVITDEVTGKTARTNEFFLELSNWSGSERRLSILAFSWAEAVRRSELFSGLAFEDALRRSEQAKLGNQLSGERL